MAQIRWQRTLVSFHTLYPFCRRSSFLILIGRFATLDEWSIRASHPCIIQMIMEAPLRLAVD
jgi:hypothetical protein